MGGGSRGGLPVFAVPLLLAVGGIAVLALHSPFELPLIGDRAYLLYVSQTAFFTGDIYRNTGFGYPPLGPLVAAAAFELGALLGGHDTLVTARVGGMLCWLACGLGLYGLGRRFFGTFLEPALMAIVFFGFAVLPMMSATNIEPKVLLLLFQLAALRFVHDGRYLPAGLAATLAAMCWQPAAVVAVALGILVLVRSQPRPLPSLVSFAAGLALGTVPVMIYLTGTGTWPEFIQQAILRKLAMEGGVLLDQPLRWLAASRSHRLADEFSIFVLAGVGLLAYAYLRLRGGRHHGARSQLAHGDLMATFTLAWACFSTLEFQGFGDLIPLLPALCYWPAFALSALRAGAAPPAVARVAAGIVAALALHDLPTAPPAFTVADQRAYLRQLESIDPHPLVLDFEVPYVLAERRLPTRFIRFNRLDDYLIERTIPGGCSGLLEQLARDPPRTILLRLRQDRNRAGACAGRILAELAEPEPTAELTIPGYLGCMGCWPRQDVLRIHAVAGAPAGREGLTMRPGNPDPAMR